MYITCTCKDPAGSPHAVETGARSLWNCVTITRAAYTRRRTFEIRHVDHADCACCLPCLRVAIVALAWEGFSGFCLDHGEIRHIKYVKNVFLLGPLDKITD